MQWRILNHIYSQQYQYLSLIHKQGCPCLTAWFIEQVSQQTMGNDKKLSHLFLHRLLSNLMFWEILLESSSMWYQHGLNRRWFFLSFYFIQLLIKTFLGVFCEITCFLYIKFWLRSRINRFYKTFCEELLKKQIIKIKNQSFLWKLFYPYFWSKTIAFYDSQLVNAPPERSFSH